MTRAFRFALCVSAGLMGVLVIGLVPCASQARFRVTYDVQSRDAKAVLIQGRVFNDTGVDVLEVWVTAEALNASGKVVGKGITFVGSSIARGDSAAFEAKLPPAEGIEKFRVAVTSYRAARETQSP